LGTEHTVCFINLLEMLLAVDRVSASSEGVYNRASGDPGGLRVRSILHHRPLYPLFMALSQSRQADELTNGNVAGKR